MVGDLAFPRIWGSGGNGGKRRALERQSGKGVSIAHELIVPVAAAELQLHKKAEGLIVEDEINASLVDTATIEELDLRAAPQLVRNGSKLAAGLGARSSLDDRSGQPGGKAGIRTGDGCH